MKTLRKAIAVIGEGITEKYYIESLRALAGNDFQILPQHSLQNRDNTDSDDVSYSEMCHFMQALNIKE